jgi:tetratricopeptide (TPR) repeat protein
MKSDENNLEKEFENFAKQFKLHKDNDESKSDLIRIIKNKLFNLNEKIIFIFDNCDSYENIECYLTMLSILKNKYVLITTRSDTFIENLRPENSVHICLEPFNENESIEFVKKNLGNKLKDENDVKDLLDLYDFSSRIMRPYLLNKMLAYVKLKIRSTKTLKQFIKENKACCNTSYIKEDNQLFEILEKKENDSWKLLKYASFLDPDCIPIDIFTRMIDFEENILDDSVTDLKELSLIKSQEKDDIIQISLHRSLQDETQKYLKLKDENEFIQVANYLSDKLIKILKQDFNEKNYWLKKKYYYNFKKIVKSQINLVKPNNYIKYFFEFSFGNDIKDFELNDEECVFYYEELLEDEKNMDSLSNAWHNIGLVFDHLGSYKKSEEYFQKSLEIKRKISDNNEENISIADTLNCLGLVYFHIGNYEESIKYYEKSLDIKRNLFNNDENKSVADTLHNIGLIYYHLGNYEKSKYNLEKSLEIKKSIFENSVSIAETLHCLGLVHYRLIDFKESIKFYKDSLSIKRKLFENDENSSIDTTLHNIGSVYYHIGKYDKSIDYYQQSLLIKKKLFKNDENNSDIANNIINIGFAYLKLDCDELALQYTTRGLSICDNILKNHYVNFISAKAYCNLSLIYIHRKEFELALEYSQKSLLIFQEKYQNQNHYYIGQSLSNIGLSYFFMKEYAKAKEYYDKSLEEQNKFFKNEKNLRVAELYNNLALYYENFNNHEKASEYNRMATSIKEKIIELEI